MRVGKTAGISIILNNWFILIMVVFVAGGMAGKVMAVLLAVVWHELAHILLARSRGLKVREIELLPFGGVARIEGLSEASAENEMLVAAAGPLASLLLAAAVYGGGTAGGWAEAKEFFFKTNIMLALFNLLPGLPLDGGRLFRAWLSRRGDYHRATLVTARLSWLLSIGLLGISCGQYLWTGTINLTFIMAAIFLWLSSRAEIKIAGFRTVKMLARKKADLNAKGIMPSVQFVVLTGAAIRDIIRIFVPDQYCVVLVVDEHCRLKGTLTETEVWEALPYRGLYAKIGELL